mmetsp:Transcript_26709/g.62101  ORF Transcript_26709/g.62101 Transcript_26709/m.62101 type:complete len:125 (+) Transcript_26709:31-405(+)
MWLVWTKGLSLKRDSTTEPKPLCIVLASNRQRVRQPIELFPDKDRLLAPPRCPTSHVANLPTRADEQDEHNRPGEVSRGEGGGLPAPSEGHVGMDSHSLRQRERQARKDAQHEQNLEKLFRGSE